MNFIPEETVTIANSGLGVFVVTSDTPRISAHLVLDRPEPHVLLPGESMTIFLYPETSVVIRPRTATVTREIVDRPECRAEHEVGGDDAD